MECTLTNTSTFHLSKHFSYVNTSHVRISGFYTAVMNKKHRRSTEVER